MHLQASSVDEHVAPFAPAALMAPVRLFVRPHLAQRSNTLRRRDGNTRADRQSGHFMRVNPLGERRKTTTLLAVSLSPPVRTPEESAIAAGLRYTTDTRPGIRRIRHGPIVPLLAPDGTDDPERGRAAPHSRRW